MITKLTRRVLPVITGLILTYILFPSLYYYGDYVRQTNPFSGQRSIEQAFTPTNSELACLRGGGGGGGGGGGHGSFPGSGSGSNSNKENETGHPSHFSREASIPNIVHFIYGLANPQSHPSAGHFDFLSYLAVRAALVSLQPTILNLHYTYLSSPPSPDPGADPLSNPWIRRLAQKWPDKFRLVHHPPPPEEEGAGGSKTSKTQYAHLSDTLRLQILLEHGGIYLDIDVFAFRSFSPLLLSPGGGGGGGRHWDTLLGYEGGSRWGLCNAVIVARPNATFIRRWLDTYENVDLEKEAWNYRSVLLPKELAEQGGNDESGDDVVLGKEEARGKDGIDAAKGDVCALPPDAFFWPTWTWRHIEWMHTPLKTKKEKDFWEGQIAKNGGGLFENQMAYHAWGQMAWDRYLKWLTPEVIRTKDTRFNLLVRRFLEDDL
ncbi:uncharacterized protein B0T23DRAFT_143478 [Neurospora hispaniola]|uniref:Glycosyltransferase family 32 protein n=1 Tax=Neurospora hispaniola TaxID=588809 RepID=A0AAJ0I814_9PEZI|nr:hypothetical protein B0T23DRAFT_143478 [Neurospora hispaniola]